MQKNLEVKIFQQKNILKIKFFRDFEFYLGKIERNDFQMSFHLDFISLINHFTNFSEKFLRFENLLYQTFLIRVKNEI